MPIYPEKNVLSTSLKKIHYCYCYCYYYNHLLGIHIFIKYIGVFLTATSYISSCKGARCSSEVERSLMVQWVIGSILHGGPIELSFVPASAPRLV